MRGVRVSERAAVVKALAVVRVALVLGAICAVLLIWASWREFVLVHAIERACAPRCPAGVVVTYDTGRADPCVCLVRRFGDES